ncbi:MAG: putative sulfate/molybdate transporter [Planctomycetota bacterium]|nr:putative sulfate/molybdate transporter [Planctomycetota bacterium]
MPHPTYGRSDRPLQPRLRFDRHELAGSVGDLGTDLPLIVGMILTAGLDPASVLIVFGAFQVLSGIAYGLPMPMQPLKAMAALVIAGQATAGQLHGAGLAIGVAMLLLSLTGGLSWLARVIPKPVVRGIQMGLGLTLANIALGKFLPDPHLAGLIGQSAIGKQFVAAWPGWESLLAFPGYLLALAGFVILLVGRSHRKWWAGPAVIVLGLLVTMLTADWTAVAAGTGPSLPQVHAPSWSDIAIGFVMLALPQLPLSISNSVIATSQTVEDLFPERPVSVRKIGLTYAIVNLIAPWFSGIPVCHGCGGLAGHYALGGRTGGSVVIYGSTFLLAGLFFAGSFGELAGAFPLPLLGALLVFEALTLLSLVRELAGSSRDWTIALIVALCAFGVPQGYLVGVLAGLLLHRFLPRGAEPTA